MQHFSQLQLSHFIARDPSQDQHSLHRAAATLTLQHQKHKSQAWGHFKSCSLPDKDETDLNSTNLLGIIYPQLNLLSIQRTLCLEKANHISNIIYFQNQQVVGIYYLH